MFKIVNITYTL